MKRKKIIILFALVVLTNHLTAQNYTEEILREKFDDLSEVHKGLNNTVQLNVSGLQLSELATSLALENNLNISIDPNLNQLISYNFFDAQVKDVLVFLYLNFNIEYEFIGSILSILPREIVLEEVQLPPKEINVKYNPANTFLSLDLKNDTLWKVTEAITKASGENFVLSPEIRDKRVNSYILNRPIDNVLSMFVKANDLIITKEEDHYLIEKIDAELDASSKATVNHRTRNYASKSKNGDFILSKCDLGTIDVFAHNVELSDVIQASAEESGVFYVLQSQLQGKVNLDVQNIQFEELINLLLKSSNYTMKKEDEVYIIGERKIESFRTTQLIRLENRTIESVKVAIPKDMLNGIEVLEFEELNGLIVTGSEARVRKLESFISTIDVVVPMVQIDVMIVYSERSSHINTGISAGVGDAPQNTSGKIFPGIEMNAGATSINAILNAISGFGFVNLGQVTENFYMSLSALESNNVISIESTPKISTLNGHEASISIGETQYYQEQQVSVQNSAINQGITSSRLYKPLDADLSVSIKPFVSADEYVTLTISVEQDDFSGNTAENAPPNITTQKFESVVRVKNGELILLGGLEKKVKNDSGSGTPLLSRIPIVKWLFSSRKKEREKSKMHILIRPVVTY